MPASSANRRVLEAEMPASSANSNERGQLAHSHHTVMAACQDYVNIMNERK